LNFLTLKGFGLKTISISNVEAIRRYKPISKEKRREEAKNGEKFNSRAGKGG
jgi:hypothetical protein